MGCRQLVRSSTRRIAQSGRRPQGHKGAAAGSTPRQPPLAEQHAQQARVLAIGLGAPLRATLSPRLCGIGQMRHRAGALERLADKDSPYMPPALHGPRAPRSDPPTPRQPAASCRCNHAPPRPVTASSVSKVICVSDARRPRSSRLPSACLQLLKYLASTLSPSERMETQLTTSMGRDGEDPLCDFPLSTTN